MPTVNANQHKSRLFLVPVVISLMFAGSAAGAAEILDGVAAIVNERVIT